MLDDLTSKLILLPTVGVFQSARENPTYQSFVRTVSIASTNQGASHFFKVGVMAKGDLMVGIK